MSRYIDAEKLLELFEQDDDLFRSQDIRHIVSKIPTADVVEVVRCVNCKYYNHCLLQSFLEEDAIYFDPNEWYCQDAERENNG